MTLFVPLDIDYSDDDEFIDAGPMAELLYIRAICFCRKKLTDGHLTRSQLTRVAHGIPSPAKHAARLVSVGLWSTTDEGWFIRGFLKHNPSRVDIETTQEMQREAGERGNHERWHVGEKGRPNAKCKLCKAAHTAEKKRQPPDRPPDQAPDSAPETGAIAIAIDTANALANAHALANALASDPSSSVKPNITTQPPTPDDDDRIMRIAERIVRHRMEGKTLANPNAYATRTLKSVLDDHTERIIELAGMFPDAPDTAIAAAVHTGETRPLAAYAPQPDNVIELPAPPPEWVRNRTKPKEAQ